MLGGMKRIRSPVIKKSGKWWIGWVEEVPGVNCQERTRTALLKTLRATLREALKFNRVTTAVRLARIRALRRSLPQGKFKPRDIDYFKRQGRA